MGITYQEEKLSDILQELEPMLKLHWEELANNKDIRPLDPDYVNYVTLNDLGILKIFTVRSKKKIVGYSTWTISKNLHYKTWLYAVSDIYWLHPDHRKTGLAYDFFYKIEDWLKSLGVNSINIQDKLTHSHTSFFNRLGFTPIEQNYEKIL